MKRLDLAGVALAGLVLWTAPLSAGTPLTTEDATGMPGASGAAGFGPSAALERSEEGLQPPQGVPVLMPSQREGIRAGGRAERGPLTKLGRGVTNVVFSFIECGTNIQKSVDEKGLPAFFEGAFTGLFYTAGRILSGAYDAVTFLIPIPDAYGPVMKPEYVFESSSRL